jgi:hypothetical protein
LEGPSNSHFSTSHQPTTNLFLFTALQLGNRKLQTGMATFWPRNLLKVTVMPCMAVYCVCTIIVACVEIVLLNYSILPSLTRLYGCRKANNTTQHVMEAFQQWQYVNLRYTTIKQCCVIEDLFMLPQNLQ